MAHTSNPLVTIGLPSYNRPKGLFRSLTQLTQQSYQNIEIIVADNCSPGSETRQVVDHFIAKDDRIRYYRHDENIGMHHNFLFVLRKALGAYFMWATDDDEWSVDFIKTCMAEFSLDVGSVMTAHVSINRKTNEAIRDAHVSSINGEQNYFERTKLFIKTYPIGLLYGVHKVDTIKWVLQEEQAYDFFDCYFCMRQTLNSNVRFVPKYLFGKGIDEKEYVKKPFHPVEGRLFTYHSFYNKAYDLIIDSEFLSNKEKRYLLSILTKSVIGLFRQHEQGYQQELVKQNYWILEELLFNDKL